MAANGFTDNVDWWIVAQPSQQFSSFTITTKGKNILMKKKFGGKNFQINSMKIFTP